jgi:hypothetical protein
MRGAGVCGCGAGGLNAGWGAERLLLRAAAGAVPGWCAGAQVVEAKKKTGAGGLQSVLRLSIGNYLLSASL